MYIFCDDVPKGQIIEAALKSMKQNKSNDFEVSALPTEEVKVDELARHTRIIQQKLSRQSGQNSGNKLEF